MYSCFLFLLAELWTYSHSKHQSALSRSLYLRFQWLYTPAVQTKILFNLKWLTTTSWSLDGRGQVPVSSTRPNKVSTRGCERYEIPRSITASWITSWIAITVQMGERGINFALNHLLLCPGKRREHVQDNVYIWKRMDKTLGLILILIKTQSIKAGQKSPS